MRNAETTEAALRGLSLPLEERERRLEKASPEVRKALEEEIAALQWVQAHVWVWQEQGTWNSVQQFLDASDGETLAA